MKVLLIQPPIRDFYHTLIRSYPFALLNLASKIDKKFEIKIFNGRAGKPRLIPNDDFKDLEIFYKIEKISPFALFKGYKLYGKNKNEIKEYLIKEKPDLIGISSNFSAHFNEVKEVMNISKSVLPECKIVLGGFHPTIYAEDVLKLNEVDFVIRGEGETPFFELINSIFEKKSYEKIKGICFKKGGKLFISDINFEKNIDYIPKRDLIDKGEYRWGGSYFSQFLTSRGCPYSCAFCGKMKAPYRKRSMESMEEEIEYLQKENIKFLSLEDEVLGIDIKFFKETLNLFKKKDFKLSCMNGIYLEILKKDILREMIDTGFKKLNLSFVDISYETLKKEKRFFNKNFEKLKEIEELPLDYEIHFIVGLPNQNMEDVMELIYLLMESRTLLAPSVYYFAPSSLDFQNCYKNEDLKYFRSSALKSPNFIFTPLVLYTFLIISRFINYIKKQIDKFEIKKIEDLIEMSGDPVEKEVIKKTIKEKIFYYYDKKLDKFIEEPVEKEIINKFFKEIKGRKIRGYKNSKFIKINFKN